MRFAHSATIIGIIQVMLIVGGFVITAALMKAHGYPDIGRAFPPAAAFVREFLILLMLIPLVWTLLSCLDYSRWPLPEFRVPIHVLTGIALIVFLFFLMINAIVAAYHGPKTPIQSPEGLF